MVLWMISLASFRLMLLLLNTVFLYSIHYQYDPQALMEYSFNEGTQGTCLVSVVTSQQLRGHAKGLLSDYISMCQSEVHTLYFCLLYFMQVAGLK